MTYRQVLAVAALMAMGMGIVEGQGARVATATSKSTFKLKGADVNPAGVPNWPVEVGDELQAGGQPVTLTFADGSVVSLAPGAKGRVEMKGGEAVFVLTWGEALYKLKSTTAVVLMAEDKQVKPSTVQGKYCVGCSGRQAGTFWTAKNTALVLAAAGGAAAGVGVAATQGGPASVSPSQF